MIDTNAEHVMAWIESSAPEHARMQDIFRRRQPGCPDGFIRASGAATAALNLVVSAYGQMCSGGDALKDYTATDLLDAARQVVEWEPEGFQQYRLGWDDYASIRALASDPHQVHAIVTAEEYDDMLGSVPPVYVSGVPGFLVGEALTSDHRGTVYANYWHASDGGYYARYYCLKPGSL